MLESIPHPAYRQYLVDEMRERVTDIRETIRRGRSVGNEEIQDLITTQIKGDKDRQVNDAAKLTTEVKATAKLLRELSNHSTLHLQISVTMTLSETNE